MCFSQEEVFSKSSWNMYVGDRSKAELQYGYFKEGEVLTYQHSFMLRGKKVSGGTVISAIGKDAAFTGLVCTIDQKGKVYLSKGTPDKLSVLKKGKTSIDPLKQINLVAEVSKEKIVVKVNGEQVIVYENPTLIGSRFGVYVNGVGSIQNKALIVRTNSAPREWALGQMKEEASAKGIHLVEDPIVSAELEDLGAAINSRFENLSPKISPDGQTLYYCKHGHQHPPIGSGMYDTYWVSTLKDSLWGEAVLVKRPFNRVKNGTGGNVTPDGNQMLVKGYYRNGKWLRRGFSIAYRDHDKWSDPQAMEIKNFAIYSQGGTDYGYLCNDGRTLIFDADPERGSYKNDLFVSFLEMDGTWSEPRNLGPDINKPGAYTVTPFLAADGKTLYFSSNGWPGYGDNDVFVSRRLDDSWTKWSEPENLGSAINSPTWDAYFNADAAGRYSYISSKRESPKSKIFRVSLNEMTALEPILLVKGYVFNTESNKPIGTNVLVTNLETGEVVGKAYSNPSNGFYEVVLPKGLDYGFFAEAEGFLSVRENLNVEVLDAYQEAEQNLGLAPIKAGQKIELRNVFFVRSKAVLMPKSLPELNKLVSLLKENPGLRISIEGHTSSTGTVEGNVLLSEKRAEKIKSYLIERGVSGLRLEAHGFGPNKPIAPNDTEENRRKNRRVEFIVL